MYTCKHGCGKTMEHRGGMNLHESLHCPNIKVVPKQELKTAQMKKEKGCSHEWRVLTPSEERYLAKQGVTEYGEVCHKCQDLR